MSTLVFAVVLSAALLHAAWNAIVKSAHDTFLTTIMVTAAAAVMAAALLPFLDAPARASWPCIAASTLFQVAYFLLIARTYQITDMSLAYPLMRGTAPFLVALVTVFVIGDALSFFAWCGVVGICVGILSMALGSNLRHPRGMLLALLNAFVIAGYTLIDGMGVRLSGAPASYTLCIFLATGIPLTVWALTARASTFVPYVMRHWRLGIAGGFGATASYGLALWAMTVTPVAVVAALRETSILFATLIAGLVLKERVGVRRIIPVCIIAASAAVLRLA
jgi:drug/metabolite transporter (DMT)-like permease